MTTTVVILGIIAAAAAWQVWVSVAVVRAGHLERRQKLLQLGLIWLLPIIGAVAVYSMLRAEGKSPYIPERGYTVPGDNAPGPDP